MRVPAVPGHAEHLRPERADADRVTHPVGHGGPRPLGDGRAVLQHQVGHEALEVGQHEQVGAVAGRDRAEAPEAVPEGRVERRADERVLRRDAEGDGVAHHPVDVAVVRDVLRLAVVGAERDPAGAVLGEQRQERLEVPRGGGLADQEPHPGAQPLASLLRRVRLVVRADPGGRVGVQRPAEHAGRVAVDVVRQRELRELGRRAADHAGEVHHLGEPDHAAAAEQRIEVARRQLAARRLELRRRHARRRHEVDVERDVVADVDQPVHAVGAEDVRDLVRVGDHRGRAERQHEPRELVDEQLRRLEVHVGVDEARGRPSGPSRRSPPGPRSRRARRRARRRRRRPSSSHSRVNTESTRPPRMTRSAGSSPRATASRRERDAPTPIGTVPFALVEVLTPRTLAEALRLRAEHEDAWAVQGGTDVMVALNFDRGRPGATAEPERGARAARLHAGERQRCVSAPA